MVLPLVLFPGRAARGRARAAVGVVPADARRHLARPPHRLVAARRARPPGVLGGRPARLLPGRAAGGDAQGGGPGWLSSSPAHSSDYRVIASMWVRASLAYPLVLLDHDGRRRAHHRPRLRRASWLMFHTIDTLGGFSLDGDRAALRRHRRSASGSPTCSSAASSGSASHVRTGTLDTMMVRPCRLLVQVCADQFQLRRVSRIVQALVVFAWAGVVRRLDPCPGARGA